MEDYRFTRVPKKLCVGDFVISCSKQGIGPKANIPFSGMAFYSPQETREFFKFKINQVEPNNKEKLLFGSDEFSIPTFLYQNEIGEFDWITKDHSGAVKLAFRISSDWKNFTLYEDHTNTLGERAFHQFGSLFSYAILNHNACVFHGVVMEYSGKGILVIAPSGTGKTTHTRLWRNYKNALIINGDRCLCRKIDGKWYAYGMPWCGSSGEYINRRVPISYIVNLKRGNKNFVNQLSAFDASIYLMQRVFAPFWAGQMQENAFLICEELGATIPMLELHCLPNRESVDVLERAIWK